MRLRTSARAPSQLAAAGTFLREYAEDRWQVPWAWWATHTYRHPAGLRTAQGDFERWVDTIAAQVRGHVLVAVGFEAQGRGALHMHAILAFGPGVQPLAPAIGARLWRKGSSQVEPYDPTKGAAFYLAKEGAWGIRVGCPRPACCRRPNRGCKYKAIGIPICPA